MQVMQESKQVFLVINPEPGSLHLGRQKVTFLRECGLGDRVSVIINRANQALALPPGQIQQFLGVPIAAQFGNDALCVEQSIGEACSVIGSEKGRHSKLARQYRAFAQQLLGASRAQRGVPAVA